MSEPQTQRPLVARVVRALAVPILLFWAVLNPVFVYMSTYCECVCMLVRGCPVITLRCG